MTEFARRMDKIKGSAIRELFKLVADPDIISFGGGNPAKESFPTEDVACIAQKLISENGKVILQYGGTEGYGPLKQAIRDFILPPKKLSAAMDEMLITSGSTQGMDLISKVFINPGDTILVEAPTFLGALQTFNSYEANTVSIPMDDEGIIVEELERLIKEYKPKIVYCIPTFQNPSGKTLSVERRKRIAKLATEFDIIVIEDDPYCDLRYEGERVPAIKEFDESNNVLYLGSFSKTVSPGLRVGYVIGDSTIIRKLTIAKQGSDLHSSLISQAIVAEYLNEGLLPEHIKTVNADYKTRRDAMLSAMDEFFPSACRYTRPSGGLFIWCEFEDKSIKAIDIFKRSVDEQHVAFVPGEHFFVSPENHTHTFRLNFSAENPMRIREGVKRLGELLNEVCADK